MTISELTVVETAIIWGHFLGPGRITLHEGTYGLKMMQPYCKKNYVMWKYNKLKRLCSGQPELTKDGRYYCFYLDEGLYLKTFYHSFYQACRSRIFAGTNVVAFEKWRVLDDQQGQGRLDDAAYVAWVQGIDKLEVYYRKQIDEALIDQIPLNALTLMVWYLDGQPALETFNAELMTSSLQKPQYDCLKLYLTRFSIQTHVQRDESEKNHFCIRKTRVNFHRFCNLIAPYMTEIDGFDLKRVPGYRASSPGNTGSTAFWLLCAATQPNGEVQPSVYKRKK